VCSWACLLERSWVYVCELGHGARLHMVRRCGGECSNVGSSYVFVCVCKSVRGYMYACWAMAHVYTWLADVVTNALMLARPVFVGVFVRVFVDLCVSECGCSPIARRCGDNCK